MREKVRGAMAAGSTKTVEAGIEMFRLGGNAFDAAAAAILASFVAEVGLASAAGGGFFLAPGKPQYFVGFFHFIAAP